MERALSHLSPVDVLESFLASEEFKKRAEREPFVPDGHYYSPIVDPQEAEEHLRKLSATPVECLSGVNLDRSQLVAMKLLYAAFKRCLCLYLRPFNMETFYSLTLRIFCEPAVMSVTNCLIFCLILDRGL